MFKLLATMFLLTSTLAANTYPNPCADAGLVSNLTIQVRDAQVLMSSLSCPSQELPAHKLAARAPRNVCGEPCTLVSCDNITGSPSPGSGNDCAIIADAMEILSAELGPTYLLNATNGYFKQLVFGSCLTFVGVSAQEDTEACWSDWSAIVRQLLNTCPTQSSGACTSIPPGLTFADFSMQIRRS
ncbi:hypothetical protein R3P38DRAFT_3019938 [Favolaschia claudopus]|uniref:Uncharacterized protein n=1 Tax=Favolaschia claudopus TaxID=2862362 RepID=A0AAW0AHM6_9AGAR